MSSRSRDELAHSGDGRILRRVPSGDAGSGGLSTHGTPLHVGATTLAPTLRSPRGGGSGGLAVSTTSIGGSTSANFLSPDTTQHGFYYGVGPGGTLLERAPSLNRLHAQSSTETSGLGETITSGFSSQESVHSYAGDEKGGWDRGKKRGPYDHDGGLGDKERSGLRPRQFPGPYQTPHSSVHTAYHSPSSGHYRIEPSPGIHVVPEGKQRRGGSYISSRHDQLKPPRDTGGRSLSPQEAKAKQEERLRRKQEQLEKGPSQSESRRGSSGSGGGGRSHQSSVDKSQLEEIRTQSTSEALLSLTQQQQQQQQQQQNPQQQQQQQIQQQQQLQVHQQPSQTKRHSKRLSSLERQKSVDEIELSELPSTNRGAGDSRADSTAARRRKRSSNSNSRDSRDSRDSKDTVRQQSGEYSRGNSTEGGKKTDRSFVVVGKVRAASKESLTHAGSGSLHASSKDSIAVPDQVGTDSSSTIANNERSSSELSVREKDRQNNRDQHKSASSNSRTNSDEYHESSSSKKSFETVRLRSQSQESRLDHSEEDVFVPVPVPSQQGNGNQKENSPPSTLEAFRSRRLRQNKSGSLTSVGSSRKDSDSKISDLRDSLARKELSSTSSNRFDPVDSESPGTSERRSGSIDSQNLTTTEREDEKRKLREATRQYWRLNSDPSYKSSSQKAQDYKRFSKTVEEDDSSPRRSETQKLLRKESDSDLRRDRDSLRSKSSKDSLRSKSKPSKDIDTTSVDNPRLSESSKPSRSYQKLSKSEASRDFHRSESEYSKDSQKSRSGGSRDSQVSKPGSGSRGSQRSRSRDAQRDSSEPRDQDRSWHQHSEVGRGRHRTFSREYSRDSSLGEDSVRKGSLGESSGREGSVGRGGARRKDSSGEYSRREAPRTVDSREEGIREERSRPRRDSSKEDSIRGETSQRDRSRRDTLRRQESRGEDIRRGESGEVSRRGGSREDIRRGGSREDFQRGESREDFRRGGSREDFRRGDSREDFRRGDSREDLRREGVLREDSRERVSRRGPRGDYFRREDSRKSGIERDDGSREALLRNEDREHVDFSKKRFSEEFPREEDRRGRREEDIRERPRREERRRELEGDRIENLDNKGERLQREGERRDSRRRDSSREGSLRREREDSLRRDRSRGDSLQRERPRRESSREDSLQRNRPRREGSREDFRRDSLNKLKYREDLSRRDYLKPKPSEDGTQEAISVQEPTGFKQTDSPKRRATDVSTLQVEEQFGPFDSPKSIHIITKSPLVKKISTDRIRSGDAGNDSHEDAPDHERSRVKSPDQVAPMDYDRLFHQASRGVNGLGSGGGGNRGYPAALDGGYSSPPTRRTGGGQFAISNGSPPQHHPNKQHQQQQQQQQQQQPTLKALAQLSSVAKATVLSGATGATGGSSTAAAATATATGENMGVPSTNTNYKSPPYTKFQVATTPMGPIPTVELTSPDVPGLQIDHIDREWERRGSKSSNKSSNRSSGKASNRFLGISTESAWTRWSRDRRASYRRRIERMERGETNPEYTKANMFNTDNDIARVSTPIKKARQEGLIFIHPDLEGRYLSEDDLKELRRHKQQQVRAMRVIEKNRKGKFRLKSEVKLSTEQWHVLQEFWEHKVFVRARYVGFVLTVVALIIMIVSITSPVWVRHTAAGGNFSIVEGLWINCTRPVEKSSPVICTKTGGSVVSGGNLRINCTQPVDKSSSETCHKTGGRGYEGGLWDDCYQNMSDAQAVLLCPEKKHNWQNAVIGLMIFAAAFGFLASILSVCGVCTSPLPRKIYYFHSAGEIFFICGLSASVALMIFPIAVEIDSTITSHSYGFGYGLGWGGAFFFFAAAICMSLDDLVRESSRAKCCRWCFRSGTTDRNELRQV